MGRIVEVEAYSGDGSDPSAHSHRGPTPRNRAMFGPAAHLYVYRIYGIHSCANVVCEPSGRGAAVLLRAVEPVQGRETMRTRRGLAAKAPAREIANGPGKLCAAFSIALQDCGSDLLRGPIELRRPHRSDPSVEIATSRRIGLSKGVELPWRFFLGDSEWVGRARPGKRPARRSPR